LEKRVFDNIKGRKEEKEFIENVRMNSYSIYIILQFECIVLCCIESINIIISSNSRFSAEQCHGSFTVVVVVVVVFAAGGSFNMNDGPPRDDRKLRIKSNRQF
jgi:hypothetical protein